MIVIGCWSLHLTMSVDGLRDDLQRRVRILGAIQGLQLASTKVERAALDQELLGEWERAITAFRIAASETGDQGDVAWKELVTATLGSIEWIEQIRMVPGGDVAADAAAHVRLRTTTDMLSTAIRADNAVISASLTRRFDDLRFQVLWSLAMVVSILGLMVLMRLRAIRLERLRMALQAARDELEDRVKERTADLSRANDDLTREALERMRAQEESERLYQRLVQAQRFEAVGRLAGGVAHAFNNLLTAIRGSNELIAASVDPDSPLHRHAENSVHATERAEAVTRQLLALGQSQTCRPHPMDLPASIQAMQDVLGRLLGEDIHLSLTLDVESVLVMADPAQVEQMIVNLVVRARDTVFPRGTIEVGVSVLDLDADAAAGINEAVPGSYAVLRVRDSGPGVDAARAERLFEPFLDTRDLARDTSLGVAAVYGLAIQNGGWVRVESVPENWTCIQVGLPITTEVMADADTASDGAAGISVDVGRILLVEDEPHVRRFVESVLSASGYEVLVASGMTEAVDVFERHAGLVDLLFSDVLLADGDGLELATRLRMKHPSLGILLSSGYLDHESRWPRIRDENFAFLPKPYALKTLVETVRTAMRDRPVGRG